MKISNVNATSVGLNGGDGRQGAVKATGSTKPQTPARPSAPAKKMDEAARMGGPNSSSFKPGEKATRRP